MHIPKDTFQTKGLRKKLVQELMQKGISSEPVLEAMLYIPRHFFYFDDIFIEKAYQNIPFQIGAGQTISAPYTVALQTQLLDVEKGQRILEIGTGSGYQTAILDYLGADVFSIERQKYLFEKTSRLLTAMSSKARLFYGDGFAGLPDFAPFDRILVTCAAPCIPDELLGMLKIGGKIVLPLAVNEKRQDLYLLIRQSAFKFSRLFIADCKFVPMLANLDLSSF